MAGQPYSERFLSVSVPAIWFDYLVPAGYRAVVRCITVVNFSGTDAAIYVAAGPTYLMARSIPVGSTIISGDYRVPFYGGEAIRCQVIGPDSFATVSGYLLRDPVGQADGQAEQLPALEPYPDPPPLGDRGPSVEPRTGIDGG